jgi:hypothetical protein
VYHARLIVASLLYLQFPMLQPVRCLAEDSAPEITVRLYNYSSATNEELREMEFVAGQILRRSAVRLHWIQCSPMLSEPGGSSECGLPLRGATFRVLLTNEIHGCRDGALGATVQGSAVVAVFYRNSSRLALIRDLPASRVLAHAAVHELGHSLLGAPHHAVSGIMKRQFGPDDLDDMQRGWLVFTPEQSRLLRAQIEALSVGRSGN